MNIWESVNVVLAMVSLVIVLAIGATILGGIQDTQTVDSYEYNVTEKGLEGAESFGNLTPVMWLVVAAAVILSILIGGLAYMKIR